MKRQGVAAFVIAAIAVAIIGPTGGTSAFAIGTSPVRGGAPAFGQDAVCADRCNAICEYCDVKCMAPPKDAKGAKEARETLEECTKKCDVDQKETDSRRWTPKVKACVQACVAKTKPCIKACHSSLGVCLRGCDR
jgi:hypothetical protein